LANAWLGVAETLCLARDRKAIKLILLLAEAAARVFELWKVLQQLLLFTT